MVIPSILQGAISNFVYLSSSKHSRRTKIVILFTWIKINLKFLLLSKITHITKETAFGYKIDSFDYEKIRYLFNEIFYRNEYLFDSINKKPIIFDCGANIGFATIFFKWKYPESEIFAFEPDKETFKMLKKNIEQNQLQNIHLYNYAISDKDGVIDFYYDSINPGSLLMSTNAERMSKDKVSVRCISIADFMTNNDIHHVDFVKLDIEGAEKDVLKDLNEKKQLQNINKLIVEYHHKIGHTKSDLSSFLQILEKNNFEYQIDTRNIPIYAEEKFQDVLIYSYRQL